MATVTAGTAKIIMNAMARTAQTNRGMRFTVIPGARSLKIVTMKLIGADRRRDADEHDAERPRSRWPRPGEYAGSVSGMYANQPPSGMSPVRKLAYMNSPADRKSSS